MGFIRENIVPFLFTLLVLGIFWAVYLYILADISGYKPEKNSWKVSIKGRIESEESLVQVESVTLEEFYLRPEFDNKAPEIKVENLGFASDDNLRRWLEE